MVSYDFKGKPYLFGSNRSTGIHYVTFPDTTDINISQAGNYDLEDIEGYFHRCLHVNTFTIGEKHYVGAIFKFINTTVYETDPTLSRFILLEIDQS